MIDQDPLAVFSWSEVALRLGSAAAAGLILGFDREIRGHAAGLRTHALVALSAAVIMVSTLMLTAQLRTADFSPDPLRAIQGLAQALGFIAAGVIFVRGTDVLNMTTAANIWVAASIGIACGCGQYRLVIVAAVLALILLILLRLMERLLPVREHHEN